ncbi:AMP-binding protein [Dyadobacter arcticus]|uniref:O-succinylbenzoic acid--CoA ligase n=1 Tax=Dyadobacter arcticus TaxID=1078754 RepID=A0ABX0UPB4_9BACT|nr:AMP-binding protein [Dyadobacter arcticus]NIJ53969.1 O-succinylbenzoic acid--CoA ligase [Dyadobacter arcticus]
MNWITSITLIKTQKRPDHPYFAQAYDFMLAWINGQGEFLLKTSGSTGPPKPILISRKQLSASARMTGKALHLEKGTRALVCLNVGYIAGLMMLVRGLELDWQLTIIEPVANPLLGPENVPEFDFVAMVPLQMIHILENPVTKAQVNGLGKILLGGAPVSVSLKRSLMDLQIPVFQSYGMTETVSHVALRRLNGPVSEENYTFLPDIAFGTDSRGCLFVSGQVTDHQIVQTNDLVEISGNSFKWIGRADNVINSGGVKIVLDNLDTIVEEVFYDLKLSNPFFTWFETDEKLGQRLILIIQGSIANISQKDILEEIRRRASAYETPKHIYFVSQFLKTPTDKLDKRGTIQQLLKS